MWPFKKKEKEQYLYKVAELPNGTFLPLVYENYYGKYIWRMLHQDMATYLSETSALSCATPTKEQAEERIKYYLTVVQNMK